VFDPQDQWKNVRQSASQFRGSVGGGSLPLRVGVGVFFLLVVGPLILSGLVALAIAVACSVVVMLIQRVFGFFSQVSSARDHQGRKNVKVVRRSEF
jgi:hypothetical protein